jgi:hypothetical protein
MFDCQQFSSYLNLVGGAHRMGPTLALTADDRASAGALWFHKQIDISDGFLTNFLVAQSDFKAAGEEGFAFVMHRDEFVDLAYIYILIVS